MGLRLTHRYLAYPCPDDHALTPATDCTSWRSSISASIVLIVSRTRTKPSATKTLSTYGDTRGHAQHLPAFMQLSTPQLLARLPQTSVGTAVKSSLTLRIGRLGQST